MLESIKLQKDYHELVEMIVCDRDSRDCMIHRCASCPGIESMKQHLNTILLTPDVDVDDDGDDDNDDYDQTIIFQQWTTVDQSELISQTLDIEEFILKLCEKLDNITTHSYIARTQAFLMIWITMLTWCITSLKTLSPT